MQMNNEMTILQTTYHWMYIVVLILLAIMLFACLIRAIRGPRIADRIVSVNMMGTMVMVMIAILSLLLKEGYLVDICLIYALVSFLAVIVISKVYMGIYEEKKHRHEKKVKDLQEQNQEHLQELSQEQKEAVDGNHGMD